MAPQQRVLNLTLKALSLARRTGEDDRHCGGQCLLRLKGDRVLWEDGRYPTPLCLWGLPTPSDYDPNRAPECLDACWSHLAVTNAWCQPGSSPSGDPSKPVKPTAQQRWIWGGTGTRDTGICHRYTRGLVGRPSLSCIDRTSRNKRANKRESLRMIRHNRVRNAMATVS